MLWVMMITKVEGREFKTKRRVKGWVGWAPVSEAEKAKFQELVLRPRCDRGESDPRDIEEGDGLVLLHDKLVATAAESYQDIVKDQEHILCA